MVCVHALQALPARELPGLQAHLASCPDCQAELESRAQSIVSMLVQKAVEPLYVSSPDLRPAVSELGQVFESHSTELE